MKKAKKIFIKIEGDIDENIIDLSKKIVSEIKTKFPLLKTIFFTTDFESDPEEERPDP